MNSTRRTFFKTMGTGAAGFALGSSAVSMASCAAGSKETDEQILFIGDDMALADTQYGKVKGYMLRGIYYFIGMPYGANTSGSNRFIPAQKPEPWTDVFPAVWWGNSAPQILESKYANRYNAFHYNWNYDDVSENCLTINVFTPAINDHKKRPVLFWIHGGGYTTGNGIEQNGYYGENLARLGDVVFCSVNHRLGPLGFSNLAGVGGEEFAFSGNVGMMDLVTALEWVRDNITNFGGDPGNVTIMGQSGGGLKVTNLLAMPSAKGLFHKAVVLSGASVRTGDKEYAEKIGTYILKEAGINAGQINKLQEIPWLEYIALANRAAAILNEELGPATGLRMSFGPCADGWVIPQHPFYPEPSPTAADIPALICSTVDEWAPTRLDPVLEQITLDGVKEKVAGSSALGGAGYGEKAGSIVDAYAKVFPEKKPAEIWSLILANRASTVELCNAKAKQSAPVYNAWFGWQPPLYDNRMRAFHCLDISFWFNNTDIMLSHTGGGSRPRNLSRKMAETLLQFMKSGDPNGGGLPHWPRYTAENGEVMILNDVSEVKNDPDREARKAIAAV